MADAAAVTDTPLNEYQISAVGTALRSKERSQRELTVASLSKSQEIECQGRCNANTFFFFVKRKDIYDHLSCLRLYGESSFFPVSAMLNSMLFASQIRVKSINYK